MQIPPNALSGAHPRALQGSQPVPAGQPTAEVNGVRASTKAAPAADALPGDPKSMLARLDLYAQGLAERLAGALQDAPAGSEGAYKDAAARLQQHLGRVRAGIEDGSLRGEDLARAMQNSLGALRTDLASASKSSASPADETPAAVAAADEAQAAEGAVDANAATIAEGRFQNIARGISARMDAMQTSDRSSETNAAVQAAQRAFTSAAARIDHAFFENGDFDRSTFYGLYSASLGRLQQRLGDLLSGNDVQDARIYDASRGVQSLNEGLERVKFDRTI